MKEFEEKLQSLLLEDKPPPRLLNVSGNTQGDMTVAIQRENGETKTYRYENVMYAAAYAQDMNRMRRNPRKWIKMWKFLDKYRV